MRIITDKQEAGYSVASPEGPVMEEQTPAASGYRALLIYCFWFSERSYVLKK